MARGTTGSSVRVRGRHVGLRVRERGTIRGRGRAGGGGPAWRLLPGTDLRTLPGSRWAFGSLCKACCVEAGAVLRER